MHAQKISTQNSNIRPKNPFSTISDLPELSTPIHELPLSAGKRLFQDILHVGKILPADHPLHNVVEVEQFDLEHVGPVIEGILCRDTTISF